MLDSHVLGSGLTVLRRTLLACLTSFILLGTSTGVVLAEAAPAAASDTIEVPGGRIRMTVRGGEVSPAERTRFMEWIRRSATIVSSYYGRFPVADAEVRVFPQSGNGVGRGNSVRDVTGLVRVWVGEGSSEAMLKDDWVLVHEMIHLALPNLDERHAWLSEGLAVYVEGVARAHAGNRDETDVWREWMQKMPMGLPAAGDEGLDHTHTWGRTYWGGALFCLLADVGIRQRTQGRKGLQDAMTAVAAKSRGDGSTWPIEKVLQVADDATGTTVLADLYRNMKDKPTSTDLDALWSRLGVHRAGTAIEFDNSAPQADIRRRIMTPRSTLAASRH